MKKKLDGDYKIASIELKDLRVQIAAQNVYVVTMWNRMDRLAAMIDDKQNQNMNIAKKGGSVRKNARGQDIEICSSGMECGQRLCFITEFEKTLPLR